MEKLTMEKIKAIELPESLKVFKKSLEEYFVSAGAGRTVDEWVRDNVNVAVDNGYLVGVTDREKYIFGLAVIATHVAG